MAATTDSLLGTFQKHIDDMRALIHCKICLKPFHEPFSLTCGHTYCYSCLSSWVNRTHNQTHNKNCPDCRQPIKTEPSPNFTLRDLVHMFVKRAELLPEDETIQEHEQDRETEAKALADDKKGPGLFRGKFSKRRAPFFGHPLPIRDPGDGVDRCPLCTWELEDGMCNTCGWGVDSDDDLSTDDSDGSLDDHHISLDGYDSEDDDRDISPIDDHSGQYGPVHGAIRDLQLGGANHHLRQALNIAMQEGEPDSEMDDFIEHDYPEEIDDDDDESAVDPYAYNPGSPPAQYGTDNGDVTTDYDNDNDDDNVPENEDDDDDDDEPRGAMPRRVVGEYTRPIEVDDSDSDSDLVSQTTAESINPVQLNAASDSDSDSESDATTQATTHDNDTAPEAPTTEGNKSDDSDDSSVREISPPPGIVRGRKRRVVESEEEDSGDDTDDTNDTAIRAPQTAAARAGRLTARRGGKVTLKYSRGESNNTSGSTRRLQPSPSPSASDTPTPSPQRPARGSDRARRGNPDQRLRIMRERYGRTVF